jgi:hypothetical protein
MNRRVGALIVGLVLGLAPVTAAYAGNSISVEGVRIFQGLHFTADVAYHCDASANAKGIDYVVHDTRTGANGHGMANYPTCDGGDHVVRIPGESTDGGTFNPGDQATVHIWMSDPHVNTVPGADASRMITLR